MEIFSSGAHISKDTAAVAKEVHSASKTIASNIYENLPVLDNLWLHFVVRRRNKKRVNLIRHTVDDDELMQESIDFYFDMLQIESTHEDG
ncbi:unnamed protein product [Arabis nemorensis]|uniref:Uncharacterized protein n=1 Tax=Arabis nemorensis TaxID=586526 RepID=A0A565CLW6_9BRAS|nr:unnamed protein product [Arabis nemorensis]